VLKKKKKTAVVKGNGSPMFNEEFDFSIEHEDVPKQYLKVCFWKIIILLT
jgi:hypothetical protein